MNPTKAIQIGVDNRLDSGVNTMLMNCSFWSPSEKEIFRNELEPHFDAIRQSYPGLLDKRSILHTFSNGGMQAYLTAQPLLPKPEGKIGIENTKF